MAYLVLMAVIAFGVLFFCLSGQKGSPGGT